MSVGKRDRFVGEGQTGRRPRILVVHDYLTQRGGAERVALSLLRAFPNAPVLTAVYNPETTYPEFRDRTVLTTWLQRFPTFRRDVRLALPLLPKAISGYTVAGFDAVVCSSSGLAHGVRTTVPKIVYCHTPARWIYEPDDYLAGLRPAERLAVRRFLPALLRWDKSAAASATTYIANSNTVRARIHRAYGREAELLFPPVAIDADGVREPVAGLAPGYLLVVSRARRYKHVRLVCEAVEQLPGERLVVVGGLPAPAQGGMWSSRLRGVTDMSDGQMRWLYANASALVGVSHEDFGLTPVEAYSFGTPSVLLRAGGYLDSSIENLTTTFVNRLDLDELVRALRQHRVTAHDHEAIRSHAVAFSEDAFIEGIRTAVERALDSGGAARQAYADSVIHLPVPRSRRVIDLTAREGCAGLMPGG